MPMFNSPSYTKVFLAIVFSLFFDKIIYLWLCWVFVAVRGLLSAVASLVAQHRL